MSLKLRLNEDLKAAMKSRDEAALSALRLLKSAITTREIEVGHDLDDDEVIKLVEKALKQRRESIGVYRQAGREDLAGREEAEARVLEKYQPEQLSPEALDKLVEEAIAETGAVSAKQMGAGIPP